MTDLRVIRTDGTDAFLEAASVQDFAESLRGLLLRSGDGGYDAARRVWNGMIDRRPALIARCAGPADVIATVRFAREHGCCWRSKAAGTTLPATPSATAG